MANAPTKLLIAASGTGGHLFPAIALAEQLPDYQIEWLGVPNRLETQLVPQKYPLHTIEVEGFQQRLGLGTVKILARVIGSVFQVRSLLKQGEFQGVFTTGGYIAAPTVIAARSLGLPVVFHEANAIPGKVTRFVSPWSNSLAVGFAAAAKYFPKQKPVFTGTPVRSQFLAAAAQTLDLPIPNNVPLIVVFGGSQGAVAMNKLVRHAASVWLDAGAWIVHLTGDLDSEADSLKHPQYLSMPFYNNMAPLLQRADLAISRAGAGSLTELAITGTPAILIPYPYAAEDHQAFNSEVFTSVGAGLMFRQKSLTPELLASKVLHLLQSPSELARMGEKAKGIAVPDSAQKLAKLVREVVEGSRE